MPPPFIVFVIPGFALFFLVQMLLCEAYHFHVTVTRHKKYARDLGDVKAINDKQANQMPKKSRGDEPEKDDPRGETRGDDTFYPDDFNIAASGTDVSAVPTESRFSDISENRLRARRKSVFAESYDPATDDDYVQIVHPKSEEEKQWLIDNLGKITLFQHLASDQIMTVVDAMYRQPVSEKDVIMKQGDKGNIFYVIQSGVFNVLVRDSSGSEKCMHTYNNQGSFGELALLYNQPRAATIVAMSDGVLWAVDGQTFRRIVHKITYEKRLMYESLINNVPMLKALKPFECSNLVDALIPKTYEDKDEIIKEGAEADGMYFVISGNVRLVVKTDTGKDVLLKMLTGGDYFGELGLLTNKPRAASAFSVGTSNLAFLDREAFERLLGPCMAIMRRNISGYQEELDELIHD